MVTVRVAEAAALVECLGGRVGGLHLEERPAYAASRGHGTDGLGERDAETAAPVRRIDLTNAWNSAEASSFLMIGGCCACPR